MIVERKDTIYETDRRAPVLLVSDRNFDATRTPPDAPDMYFPVFSVRYAATSPSSSPYSVVLTGRPYAGLIGSEIRHPAGDARVIMGEVDATNGSRHFEIFVGEDACEQDATPALDIQSQPNSKSPSPYTISLKGNTTVSGDVNVYGAVAFQPPDDAAKQQRGQPGTVYLRKGSLNPDGTTNPNTRDLSVELGRSGDEPTRFSVGVWSTENPAGFKPIFTVDANGNVTINGRLIAASVQPLPQGTALTNEVISLIRQRQLAARPISASAGGLIGDILQGIFGSRAAEAEARIDGRATRTPACAAARLRTPLSFTSRRGWKRIAQDGCCPPGSRVWIARWVPTRRSTCCAASTALTLRMGADRLDSQIAADWGIRLAHSVVKRIARGEDDQLKT
ncbi:MAG: hypothetical protein U0521_22490 [Anaerolineae bacterium]